MTMSRLTKDQELEAKHLEDKIKIAIAREVADLARLLVGTGEKDLFGATEFQVRELVLRIGAKPTANICAKKKRLPIVFRRLPRLSTSGRVPGLSAAQAPEHSGAYFPAACILLLPSLRWPISLG
jgi:hypothetical protein